MIDALSIASGQLGFKKTRTWDEMRRCAIQTNKYSKSRNDRYLRDNLAMTGSMNELGYATTKDEMHIRLGNIQKHKDCKTFIASTDAQVVGMVGMKKNYSYEQNGIHVRVLALVRKYDFRKSGVGKKLMEKGFEEEKVKGFKPYPAAFFGYIISHESHHRGQIMLVLKQSGHPADQKIQYGLWEWGSR